MGTTADSWTVAGALNVSGAATLSSTLAVAGASTLTGAVTCSSTLTVDGASTQTGDVAMAAALNVGSIQESTYDWMYVGGSKGPKMLGAEWYDWGTNVYRACYLKNGTFTVT
jgi:hypothetical protein